MLGFYIKAGFQFWQHTSLLLTEAERHMLRNGMKQLAFARSLLILATNFSA